HRANQQVDQPSCTEPAQDFGPYRELDAFGARRIPGDVATATEPLAAGDCPEVSPFPGLLSGSLSGPASMPSTLRGSPESVEVCKKECQPCPCNLASYCRARRLSRLGIGCAEQRLVGGAEVGCGQATWVRLPDLLGYGDGDLDV